MDFRDGRATKDRRVFWAGRDSRDHKGHRVGRALDFRASRGGRDSREPRVGRD